MIYKVKEDDRYYFDPEAAEKLKGLEARLILSSPLRRTRETAAPLAKPRATHGAHRPGPIGL